MKEYRNIGIDDWNSDERYKVAYNSLKENKNAFSFELAKNILSGEFGFICQYDRKTGADTVWSVTVSYTHLDVYKRQTLV